MYISAATTWEISIKSQAGKLTAPGDMARLVEEEGFAKLPISLLHGEIAGHLPTLHKDPFDRMLITQAKCEDLVLMTKDEFIVAYEVATIDPKL